MKSLFALVVSIGSLPGFASAAIAATPPADCIVTPSVATSPANGLRRGAEIRLTASCATGTSPITFAWDQRPGNSSWVNGYISPVVIDAPFVTTTYFVTPSNAAGAGAKVSATVYVDGDLAPSVGAPSGCSIVQFPDSIQTPVAAGSTIALAVTCTGPASRNACSWNNGIAPGDCNVNIAAPVVTTLFEVVGTNIFGVATPATAYVQIAGSVVPDPGAQYAPANCSVAQLPDSTLSPVATGTNVRLTVSCAAGQPVTSCNWMSMPSTSCIIDIAAPAVTTSYLTSATNSFGAGPGLNTVIRIAGSTVTPPGSDVQSIAKANVTINGIAPASPAFVTAGDVVRFDAIVGADSTDPARAIGLGLCLEYARDVAGDPTIRNLSTTSLIADGGPSWLRGCNRGGYVYGADTQIVKGWALTSGGGGWPAGPLPFKLYDAEFSLAASPAGSTSIGFTSSGTSGGHQFRPDGPLVLCGKPTVKTARDADATAAAKFIVTLSAAVPLWCGTGGAFPVSAELVGTTVRPGYRNSDFTVSGYGVEIDGDALQINFGANGFQTSVTLTVTPVNGVLPVEDGALSLRLLPGTGNYDFDANLVQAPIRSFSTAMQSLQVSSAGNGSGKVTSNVPGIDCGSACVDTYIDGTVVTLTATPTPGSIFVGWLGACTGRGACSVDVNGSKRVSASFAPETTVVGLDIDGDLKHDALTDGMLLMRYMFGMTGGSLIGGVVGAGAMHSDAAQLLARMNDIRPLLDVDGNGAVDALTDGLLLTRYFFGLRGPALIASAIGTGAIRTTAQQIESYIQGGMK